MCHWHCGQVKVVAHICTIGTQGVKNDSEVFWCTISVKVQHFFFKICPNIYILKWLFIPKTPFINTSSANGTYMCHDFYLSTVPMAYMCAMEIMMVITILFNNKLLWYYLLTCKNIFFQYTKNYRSQKTHFATINF